MIIYKKDVLKNIEKKIKKVKENEIKFWRKKINSFQVYYN